MIELALAGAIAGAVAGVIAGALVGTRAGAGALARVVFFFPGYFFGLWIVTLLIRFLATGRHLFAGYQQAPANIERLAFRTAPFHMPELLPGLPPNHHLHLRVFTETSVSEIKNGDGLARYLAVWLLVLSPFLFIPGWAYRIILKSTLWFWWILFIVGGAPKIKDGIEGLRVDVYGKLWKWIGIAFAIFTIGGLVFGPAMRAIADNHSSNAPLLSVAALLFLVDWKKLSNVTIYQELLCIAAFLTLAVVLWAQSLVEDWKVSTRQQKVNQQLPWLGYLVNLKSGLGAATIALTMLYFALYANAQHGRPPGPHSWSAQWLHKLYGENACALLRLVTPCLTVTGAASGEPH
jgi:hypothetical protein